jgi:hypothetical protein
MRNTCRPSYSVVYWYFPVSMRIRRKRPLAAIQGRLFRLSRHVSAALIMAIIKVIDYNEMRDINGRDAVPEKRVKDAYVSLKARAYQKRSSPFRPLPDR